MSQINQPNEGQAVGTAVSNFEAFFKNNQKVITGSILGILIILVAIFSINRWYITPQKEEAKAQMFAAEQAYRADSFEIALNGDGNAMGFTQVIKEYGKKAGAAVYLYAGISELQLGNNEQAISYLKQYNGKDKILKARALSCMGDAYANMGELSKAFDMFKKAAAMGSNAFTASYIQKAATIAEEMGNDDVALKLYEELKVKYPQTIDGAQADKYISRIKNK